MPWIHIFFLLRFIYIMRGGIIFISYWKAESIEALIFKLNASSDPIYDSHWKFISIFLKSSDPNLFLFRKQRRLSQVITLRHYECIFAHLEYYITHYYSIYVAKLPTFAGCFAIRESYVGLYLYLSIGIKTSLSQKNKNYFSYHQLMQQKLMIFAFLHTIRKIFDVRAVLIPIDT